MSFLDRVQTTFHQLFADDLANPIPPGGRHTFLDELADLITHDIDDTPMPVVGEIAIGENIDPLVGNILDLALRKGLEFDAFAACYVCVLR